MRRRAPLTIRVVLVGVLLGLTGVTAVAVAAIVEPFPDSNSIPEWVRSGATETFTRSELYGYINGGAELYLELGFETLRLQRYRNGEDRLTVELYRMTDPAAALGVYLAQCGTERRDETFDLRHTVGRYQLQLVKSRYYVSVKNDSGHDSRRTDLVRFGRAVAYRIPDGEPIPAVGLLPAEGRIAGSLRILRGPVGLQSICTLGPGDVLRLGGTVTALSARYSPSDGAAHTRILVPYPTTAAALEAFRHLATHLDPYLEVLVRDTRRVVFKDYTGRYGRILLDARRIDIRLHLDEPPPALMEDGTTP